MRRREFITLIGGVAAWPLAARAQQPAAKPVIGFLRITKAEESGHLVAAFRQGLRESGYASDRVVIEPRWADGREERLPKLASELVASQVAAIAAGSLPATRAAKAALRDYVAVGGLMSYATDFADSFHQVGVYTGTILKGAKPADLPVLQPTKFEFVINRTTAKALGLTVPAGVFSIADEVIE